MTFGEKYTSEEVDKFYDMVGAQGGYFNAKYCGDMLTGKLKDD